MKLRRLAPALLAAALLLPLAACSSSGDYAGSTVSEPGIAPQADGPAALDGTEFIGTEAGGLSSRPSERSVIRSGDISIQVGSPAESAGLVAEIAEGLDGYVESESIGRDDEGSSSSAFLMLRVPAERLDEAFVALGEVGTVLSQSRSASDVTTQHVDLQARVKALEESIERLTELMSGAATTGELIEAESALSQRQQELDGLRAQLEALEGQVAQATVSVSLTSKSVLPGGPDNFWEGLVAGWQSLVAAGAGALVLFGVLLPWLVILGAIALVIVLIVRARRRAGGARGGPNAGLAGAPAPDPGPPAGSPATAAQVTPSADTAPSAGATQAPGYAPVSDAVAPPASPDHPDHGR